MTDFIECNVIYRNGSRVKAAVKAGTACEVAVCAIDSLVVNPESDVIDFDYTTPEDALIGHDVIEKLMAVDADFAIGTADHEGVNSLIVIFENNERGIEWFYSAGLVDALLAEKAR